MTTDGGEYLKEVKSPTNLKRVLQFEIPRERVDLEVDGIMRDIKKEIALPGFRKGKAPLDMIKARFAETAQKEAIEKLIPEAYQQALEKGSFRPVIPAEISNMDYGAEGPLSFEIAIELFPEVEIDKYKGIKARKETKTIEDTDIDKELEGLRQRLAQFEKLDCEAETGNVVVMDYWRVGTDEKMVPGSKVTGYPTEIGAGGLVKDFDDALIGVKKGDRKTVEVTYPDDFPQEEMRGSSVTFGFEVLEVGKKILPEIGEEFAKTLGLDSMESVRSKINEGLAASHEQESIRKMKQEILHSIVKDSRFEVPDGLVNMGLESMMKSYKDEHEKAEAGEAQKKLDEIREQLRPLAVNIVKEQFIIDDIAKREKIAVGDDEIEEVLKSIADRTGISIDEARRRAAESDEIGRWRRDILKGKVLDFLLEHADVKK
ncbi:MAG: trigger factor [Candidatus Eisenbacteria bacterium]